MTINDRSEVSSTMASATRLASLLNLLRKSTPLVALFVLGIAITVVQVGCSSSDRSPNATAQPTVELIRTATINTATPSKSSQNSGLNQGNAGTWMPGSEDSTDPNDMQRVTQTLVAPPFLPEHEQVATGAPKVVEVRLEVEEKVMEIGPDRAEIWGLTFNGTIPAPMIVVHQNDYIELTLVNPLTNSLQHNIDLHAATGAMGGGELTLVNPGQEVTFRFKAVKPGVFVYHCAPGGPMIPFHVVSGMNGAIMVLPREGLADAQGNLVEYDMAYFVGEQDFYIPQDDEGNWMSYDTPAAGLGDMIDVMKTLTPTHVVFNGAVGALTGENALKAEVGEKVLIIHAQANRDSRPHLIGGHADLVWQGGSFSDLPDTIYETWFVPGGSAVAALYEFRQPGVYAYVSHNLIEAILLGAAAHFVIDGEWNDNLMTQTNAPAAITATSSDSGSAGSVGIVPVDGHTDHAHGSTTVDSGAEKLEITATEFKYEAAILAVAANDPFTISLHNDGMVEHDIVIEGFEDEGGIHAGSGEGGEATYTLPEPGEYKLYCTIPGHRDAGMEVTLTVSNEKS